MCMHNHGYLSPRRVYNSAVCSALLGRAIFSLAYQIEPYPRCYAWRIYQCMHLAISPNNMAQFNHCAYDCPGTVSKAQPYIPSFIVMPHLGITHWQLLNKFIFQVVTSFAEAGTLVSITCWNSVKSDRVEGLGIGVHHTLA